MFIRFILIIILFYKYKLIYIIFKIININFRYFFNDFYNEYLFILTLFIYLYS